ncbi:MAG: diguanylate cyclase [Pseudomonadales bacterium]|nr:diguanylate cyclase [Pseudomonadales bacterium]
MMDKAVILLVDDAPANVQMLADILKDDYTLKVATSGERALELAVTEPMPDLILLDILMPDMNGFEVCNRLKSNARLRDIPVIFVTGKDIEEGEELGLEMGAVDYITKPLRPAVVWARVRTHITIKQQRDKLTQMALTDQLTAIYNRHYLIDAAKKKIFSSRRHQHPLSLIMIDVDFFKAVNDHHGHPVGDAVLKAIAALLQAGTRQEDVLARFGGEEFVLLLEMCDLRGAMDKAELLRQGLEKLKPAGLHVTASFGVTELADTDSGFEDFLKRADDAVYQAKENGRNTVVAISP